MKNRILIIAAHPDDEILGCGGTVSRLVKEGYEAFTLILGEGITSRNLIRDRKKCEEQIDVLKKQIQEANRIIGIKETFVYDFPDNRFDSVALLDIVKVIEEIKQNVKPNIIFTHYANDLNIDHKITYNSVLTATRPMIGECTKEIYSFEVPSSTEWNYPLSFNPDVYFDISSTLDIKQKAMEKYISELRNYPHPRSIKYLMINAENWGIRLGIPYAEAFKSVRVIK